LKVVKSPYFNDFDEIWYATADLELGNNCVIIISTFLKLMMADGCHTENRFFGHKLAADCPISVKFCMEKRFLSEFPQWDRYPLSTERISFL